MTPRISRTRGRLVASAVAVLLGVTAAGATAAGLNGAAAPWDTPTATTGVESAAPGTAPPAPPAGDSHTTPSSPAPADSHLQTAAPAAPAPADAALAASIPIRLRVPAAGIDTSLIQLGKEQNGEVQVPPAQPGSPAGWYTGSSAPGQTGSAVVLGHVNAIGTPIGVFYRLHELVPGDQATVVRADGTAAVFAVDRVDTYHKASFPTVEVYRNADRPELRLITCGGYEPASGQYVDNVVVYAHLVSTHAS